MKPNRYLGVTADLPTVEAWTDPPPPTHAEPRGLPIHYATAELERYAFPGGYEIVYVTAEGDDLCHECAQRGIDYSADSIGINRAAGYPETVAGLDPLELHDRAELLAGWYSIDTVDTCATCAECGRHVLATGCETDDAGVEHHGEYCDLHTLEETAR